MKKMNQFMMGMLAIAATAFTSCSNEDGLGGNGQTSRESVENFYMKLQITGNDASTRSVNDNPTDGTKEESTIKSGTIWLVDEDGTVAFCKKLTANDWDATTNKTPTTKPIKVSVNKVSENTPYKVYFLANKTDNEVSETQNPVKQELTSTNGGKSLAIDNQFVMFNENDKSVQADKYIVTFTATNQDETQPATPTGGAIKLDRLTARIENPTSDNKINIAAKQNDKTKNIEAITEVSYQGYSPFNVAKKTHMMQTWSNDWTLQTLPTQLGDFHLPMADFGNGRNNAATEPASWSIENSYILENTADTEEEATGIFLKYKVTTSTKATPDFADGTFYRYDGYVFTSVQDIMDADEVDNPFGTLTADQVVDLIKGKPTAEDPTKFNLTTDETKIAKFRTDYHIEVFERGEAYYSYYIEDAHHTGKKYSVLRNSIYRIEVKNIYDLGSDTPNTPPITPNYYLDVEVTVNPWVLNNLNIDLK